MHAPPSNLTSRVTRIVKGNKKWPHSHKRTRLRLLRLAREQYAPDNSHSAAEPETEYAGCELARVLGEAGVSYTKTKIISSDLNSPFPGKGLSTGYFS